MRLSTLPRCVVLALAGPACIAVAQAEALADPTRPPAALFAPAAAASAVPVHAAQPAVPHVQSIRLAAGGASSALVDGHLVTLGDKVGGRTVVAIDASGLQLRDAQGRSGRLPLIDAAVVVKQTLPNTGSQAPTPVATLAGGQQP
jgi:MSHA biogenesis protein MshK